MAVDIASLTIAIDTLQAVKAGEDLDKLTKSSNELSMAAEFLKGKFAGLLAILGPTALAAGFVLSIKNAVELEAGLVRLSQIAGTTAANMSGLILPAALAGTSLEAMASAMGKLNREVGLAKLGDVGNKSLMLAAIGIDPAAGEDPAEVLLKVARALVGMKDQSIAAKVAFDLLGRSYAELKPALIELVNQGGIVERVSNEQAAAAKELTDNWIKLKIQFEESARELTDKLIPKLNTTVLLISEIVKQRKELAGYVLAGLTFGLAGSSSIPQPAGASQSDVRRSDLAMGLGSETVGGDSTQKSVQRLFDDQKTYAARLSIVKHFGEQWQESVKLAIDLVDAEEKAGLTNSLRSQEEGLLAKQKLADLGLQAAIATARRAIEEERKTDPEDTSKKQLAQRQAIETFEGERVALAMRANAQISVLRSQSDQQLLGQAEAVLAAYESAGEGVANSLRTVAEMEQQSYIIRFGQLEAFLLKGTTSEKEAAELRRRLAIDHEASRGSISAQGQQDRLKFDAMTYDQQAMYLANFGATATQTAAAHNKKMFELNKIFGEAQIIVSTTIGVMKAWEMGPIIGPIMAVLVGAAGALNLQTLRATQYGGGGGIAPSIGAATGGAMPVVNVPTTPASTLPTGSGITVIVQGNFIGNEQFMRDVVLPAIQSATNNKDFLLFGPNSRQAGVQSGVGVS